jgi:alpha-beta hydrolase superfamily lysophospholipase
MGQGRRVIDRRALIIGLSASALLAAKAPTGPEQLNLLAKAGRKVEIWRWTPRGKRKGRIHFSHGNFSSPVKYSRLLEAWATEGWEVLAPLHVDSSDHPDKARYGQLDSWPTRLEDLALLSADAGKQHYVAAGHSYGALMALVLGGAKPLLPGSSRDPKVPAVIALSPPGPMAGFIDAESYASLAVPALIQTGDKDIFPGMPPEAWRNHLAAFEAPKPSGALYSLVLPGADHYLGGIYCRPELPGPKAETAFVDLKATASAFLLRYGAGQAKGERLLDKMVSDKKLMRR